MSDLQIDADVEFERRIWFVQRVLWAALAVVLAAGVAGAFGAGPLSRGVARSASGLAVEYERFLRVGAPTLMHVHVAGAGEEARLWVNAGFAREFDVDSIVPEARVLEADEGRIVYAVPLRRGGGSATVHFRVRPRRGGSVHVAFGSGADESVEFEPFVYP